jgi:hypothetical protein
MTKRFSSQTVRCKRPGWDEGPRAASYRRRNKLPAAKAEFLQDGSGEEFSAHPIHGWKNSGRQLASAGVNWGNGGCEQGHASIVTVFS